MGMGTSKMYPRFKPFNIDEFEKHLYLYYYNGLNPSPQVQMKFRSADVVQGSKFISDIFGSSAERRHREWKCCFASQDPLVQPPSRASHPNWKVDPFLKHVQEVSRVGWKPFEDHFNR